VRFLIDAMLPPATAVWLNARGHDAVTPIDLGGQDLPDALLIEMATAQQRIIVTENSSDFAHVEVCSVLLVRKSWWRAATMAGDIARALNRWAEAYPEPGLWARWLDAEFR